MRYFMRTCIELTRRSRVHNLGQSLRNVSSVIRDDGIVYSPAPTLELPSGNLAATFFKHASDWKDLSALECGITGRQISYADLIDQSMRWSGFLKRCGIGKGDIVGIVAENCPQYAPLFIGTIAIGAVLSPINSKLMPGEISRLLKTNETSFLIGDESTEANVGLALNEIHKSVRQFCIGKSKFNSPNIDDILEDKRIPFVDPVPLTGEELMYLPFSSGTTGLPKAVSLSHNSFNKSMKQFFNSYHNIFPNTAADGHQERFMAMLPFFHIYGMYFIFSVGVIIGGKTITLPRFDPEKFLSTLIKHKITTLHMVPTLMNFLNSRSEVNSDLMGSLELLICGAAPVLPAAVAELKGKLKKNRKLDFVEGYGMTEVLITHMSPRKCGRFGTAGQLISNVEAKVVDSITREILGPNQDGEICLRNPARMIGYYKNPEATANMITEDNWLQTGDVGHYDKDGYFYIVDRTKDLIKVNGLQVSPTELEEVLQSHPSVIESSVIGVSHERCGEVPKAYVIARDQIHEEELKKYVASKMSKHKHLVGGIVFVDTLPKTDTGKILRRELRKLNQ